MAEGRDDHPAPVTAEPEAIREEMAQTRAALTEVLSTLKRRLIDPLQTTTTGDNTPMAKAKKKKPTAKETKESASKLGRAKNGKSGGAKKSAAKGTTASKSAGSGKSAGKSKTAASKKSSGKGGEEI